jgi:hypothetical protein
MFVSCVCVVRVVHMFLVCHWLNPLCLVPHLLYQDEEDEKTEKKTSSEKTEKTDEKTDKKTRRPRGSAGAASSSRSIFLLLCFVSLIPPMYPRRFSITCGKLSHGLCKHVFTIYGALLLTAPTGRLPTWMGSSRERRISHRGWSGSEGNSIA